MYNRDNTKRILLSILLGVCILVTSLFLAPKKTLAFQNFDVCYSQAAAYHFYWHADLCWDMFKENCNAGALSSTSKVIFYLKNIYDVAKKGKTLSVDVITTLKAMLLCKPLIDDCIAPKLQVMKDRCTEDALYYAANLTSASTWYNRDAPGLYYNDKDHTLTVQVLNNGTAYTWDIPVNVSYGTTSDRKKPVSGGGFLMENEMIPELTFFGAQQSGSQTLTGSVKNFLIDESNLSGLLQKYKDDHSLKPFYWEKTIPFTAPEGKLTKITMMIDPNQDISEQSEKDNLYSLIIDKLPTPSRFQILNFTIERKSDSLTEYIATFDIKNTGEETGSAAVKWSRKDSMGSITESGRQVAGGATIHIEKTFSVDVSKSGNSCKNQTDYRLEIFDNEGGLHDDYEFEIPSFGGEIYGRVENLFGKPVEGAVVTTDTGATATTGKTGFYHITGINKLGKIKVTASHPSYSDPAVNEVELKFDTIDFLHSCHIAGLTLTGVNLVLKDKPVDWHIIFKDQNGEPIQGNVFTVNEHFRHAFDVPGEVTKEDLQPGNFDVTFSASGYYPQFKTITLIHPAVTTEIIFEKIGGRENDDGLRIVTPRLLWKKQLGPGRGFIDQMVSSKNGKLLVVSLSNNKTKKSSLFFINPLTGAIIKETSIPYFVSNQKTLAVDSSYDGRTVGVFFNTGAPGKTDKEKVVKIYDAAGNEKGTTTMDNKSSIFLDVALDGFYLFPGALLNSSLHKYTRKEIEGIGSGHDLQGYGSFIFFRRNGTLVSHCKERVDGWCERSIADAQIRKIGEIRMFPQIMDESYGGEVLMIRTPDAVYAFGSSSWTKEFRREPSFTSLSVSPGGMYVMATGREEQSAVETLKIYGNTGGDKTPEFDYDHVRYVSANDKGLFFAQVVSDKMEYYQVGAYQKDYNAPSTTSTNTKNSNFLTGFFSMMQDFFKKMTGIFGGKKL